MKKWRIPAFVRMMWILFALLIPLSQPHIAFAAGQSIQNFYQLDLDGDGRNDEAVINCACVTTHDQIRVFDTANDMQTSQQWQNGTDIANDIWVLDVGQDGTTNLIIQFLTDHGEQIARLYDDVNGDGVVSYHVDGKMVHIDESPYWTLEVIAKPGWFTPDGRVNLNIQAHLDKPAGAGFEFVTDSLARQYLPHDGQPDIEFRMVDENNDGAPDYFLSRLLADIPQQLEVGRSRLAVNVERKQTRQPDTALFWPFLDLQPASGAGQSTEIRFFDLLPNISIDWVKSSIRGFSLPGYPIESGYFVNSQSRVINGKISDSSYEVPHAWYDLAGDHDGNPELNIRLFQPLGQSREEIRFSWNQHNSPNLVWDYKLGMLGDPPIDGTVDFHTFGLRMIPYEQLPSWVTGQDWELVTFVAREGAPRLSAEGIYAWSPWSGADPLSANNPSNEALQAALSYVTGASTDPPYQFFKDIWEGFRGEYNFIHPQKPMLYFSPIDHRLHLKGAEHGLLNLGNARYITYDNQDGDDYLEQWKSIADGQIQKQLYVAKEYLVYSSESEVLLKKTNPPKTDFESLPPRNHQEWLDLGQKLSQYQLEIAPDDLKAMIQQFEGSEIQIQGGSIRDFRDTKDGFRFVLTLQPGFQIGGSGVPGWDHLSPGRYAVTYDRSFHIEPFTSANLSLSLVEPNLTQFKSGDILVSLQNKGLEDLPHASLELIATSPDKITSIVATKDVQLFALNGTNASLAWTPTAAGEWLLIPVIRQPDGQTIIGKAIRVNVLPPQTVNFWSLVPLSVPEKFIPMIVIGLLIFALFGSRAFYQAWSRPRSSGGSRGSTK